MKVVRRGNPSIDHGAEAVEELVSRG